MQDACVDGVAERMPAMAVSKRRLRWVFLIALIVLPLTIIAGLVWFVASDTWMQREAKSLSAYLGLEVTCADMRLSGPESYVYDAVAISDESGQTILKTDRVRIDKRQIQDQKINVIDLATFELFIQQRSLLHWAQLLEAYIKSNGMCLLLAQNGTQEQLRMSLGIDADGVLSITASGTVPDQHLLKLADAFQALSFIEQIPDFIFANSFMVDQFNCRVQIADLSIAWDLSCHWPEGSAQLSYDGQSCTVQAFEDKRLPLFRVAQGVELVGLKFNDARLQFHTDTQLCDLHFSHDSNPVHLRVEARQDDILLHIQSGTWPASLSMLEAYLPAWLYTSLPQQWSLAGSSWSWNASMSPRGQVQLQYGSYFIRGAWSLAQHLELSALLVRAPHMSAHIQSLNFSNKAMHIDGLQCLQAPWPLRETWQHLPFATCEITRNQDVLSIKQDKEELLYYASRHMVLRLGAFPARQVNALMHRPLFEAGDLMNAYLQIQLDKQIVQGITKNVHATWPQEVSVLPDAFVQYEHNDQFQDWRLLLPNMELRYRVVNKEDHGKWSLVFENTPWQPFVQMVANVVDTQGKGN